MRIRILKPNLTILGKVREVGEIVNDADPNECRNLVADGRAEHLTIDEETAAQQRQDEEDLSKAQSDEAAKHNTEHADTLNPS